MKGSKVTSEMKREASKPVPISPQKKKVTGNQQAALYFNRKRRRNRGITPLP